MSLHLTLVLSPRPSDIMDWKVFGTSLRWRAHLIGCLTVSLTSIYLSEKLGISWTYCFCTHFLNVFHDNKINQNFSGHVGMLSVHNFNVILMKVRIIFSNRPDLSELQIHLLTDINQSLFQVCKCFQKHKDQNQKWLPQAGGSIQIYYIACCCHGSSPPKISF